MDGYRYFKLGDAYWRVDPKRSYGFQVQGRGDDGRWRLSLGYHTADEFFAHTEGSPVREITAGEVPPHV